MAMWINTLLLILCSFFSAVFKGKPLTLNCVFTGSGGAI